VSTLTCPGCSKSVSPLSDGTCPSCGLRAIAPAPPPATEPEYGGFWVRAEALFYDVLILSPLLFLMMRFQYRSQRLYTLLCVAQYALLFFYHFYCVKRWGGTPGKLLAGLRVVPVSLGPLRWKNVLLRDGVGMTLGIVSTIWYVHALNQLAPEEFLNQAERWARIDQLKGPFYRITSWLSYVWMFSELLVLLTNRRRRALHDFIAGTVVLRVRKPGGGSA
jgi:uncharacterized RDD family membrane protein YckC